MPALVVGARPEVLVQRCLTSSPCWPSTLHSCTLELALQQLREQRAVLLGFVVLMGHWPHAHIWLKGLGSPAHDCSVASPQTGLTRYQATHACLQQSSLWLYSSSPDAVMRQPRTHMACCCRRRLQGRSANLSVQHCQWQRCACCHSAWLQMLLLLVGRCCGHCCRSCH
jgi:hypothetical protein